MSDINRVKWQRTCCEWHGHYAEHPLTIGGVARLKRSPDKPGMVLVSRFGPDNRAIDKDADGVPVYVELTEEQAAALLA